MGIVLPDVVALVHPVDLVAHPTYPGGWRWAVQVGGGRIDDLDRCVGAGHCETESEASVAAEQHASVAVKALRLLGVPAGYGYLRLGHDPIPAEADDRPIGVWRGEDGGS